MEEPVITGVQTPEVVQPTEVAPQIETPAPQVQDKGVQTPEVTTPVNTEVEKPSENWEQKAQEAKAEAERVGQFFDSIYKTNPEAYEAFRNAYNKANPAEQLPDHNSIYGQAPSQPTNQPVNENQIVEMVEERIEAKKNYDVFFSKYPDMNPLTAQNPQEVKQLLSRVAALGDIYLQGNPSASAQEALEYGYRVLPENQGKIQAQTQKNAELAGAAKVLNKGVGASAPVTSGGTQAPTGDGLSSLSEGQRNRYNELLRDDPNIAEKFLKNIVES